MIQTNNTTTTTTTKLTSTNSNINPISTISTSPTSTISTSSSSTTSSTTSQTQFHHPNQPTTINNNNNNNNNNNSSSLPHDIFSITDEELAAQYTFETEIGYGNWGSIWRISTNPPSTNKNQSRSKKTLAIKLVHRDKTSNTTNARVKSLWGEFKTLRRFKSNPSPNVLRISSFIITPSYALLTMAFHPALLPVRLSESNPKTIPYLRGLLSGIDFLHRHHITHNDIKPANVVISEQDQPVFIDFGFAVSYGSDWEGEEKGEKKYWSQLSWGTPEYLSPQRARGEPHDERLSDIWSLGITMYEVVVGRTPFESDDHEEFLTKEALQVYYERTLTGEFLGVHHLSKPLKDLLKSMVQPDPKKRLTSCANGMLHPFFESYTSAPHSRRSVIGSSIQDRLKAFEHEQGGPTPINKPIQQLATNTRIKPEPTSAIKVFRDDPELNTKTPSKKKNSLPPRVLTPQCQNTPPASTMTKRVPVPYSKLHPHHQQQQRQENLLAERTPTLANGRHYVTKTPVVVKRIINADPETDSTAIQLDKQDDHSQGEPRVKKLDTVVDETPRPKTIKDDAKVEEEMYQPLKSTHKLMTESMKKNRLSNQSCDRELTLNPKDQDWYTSIGSNTPTIVTRLKSPRKPLTQRPTHLNLRPKTAGPSIKIQTEGVSRYRPRSAHGPITSENNGVCVGPKKLFKDRMELESDKKALGSTTGSPRLKEIEKKVEERVCPTTTTTTTPNHLNNSTPLKNPSIDDHRISLSTSPNLHRTPTKSLTKKKEEGSSKIPMSQTRLRTTSVRVSSSTTTNSPNLDLSQKNSSSMTLSTTKSSSSVRRRTSSSINPRTTTPCKSISPLKKERTTPTTTTPNYMRNRSVSGRVGIVVGKSSKSLEQLKKKSSLKPPASVGKAFVGGGGSSKSHGSPNPRMMKRSMVKSYNRQSTTPTSSPTIGSKTLGVASMGLTPKTSKLTSASSTPCLPPRARSCFIGPSSLIK